MIDNGGGITSVAETAFRCTISTISDLATADWFGLITGVFVAGEFDIHVRRNNRERVFYVGGKSSTILFRYEICKMDKNGSVYETVS